MTRKTNFKKVKVKQERICHYCEKKINKGSNAITINPYMKGRKWFHENCYEILSDIKETEQKLKNITFDDEGAYYAYKDYIEDLMS